MIDSPSLNDSYGGNQWDVSRSQPANKVGSSLFAVISGQHNIINSPSVSASVRTVDQTSRPDVATVD